MAFLYKKTQEDFVDVLWILYTEKTQEAFVDKHVSIDFIYPEPHKD